VEAVFEVAAGNYSEDVGIPEDISFGLAAISVFVNGQFVSIADGLGRIAPSKLLKAYV